MKKLAVLVENFIVSICLVIVISFITGCVSDDDVDNGDDNGIENPVGTVYLDENFNGLIWGGDYINQEPGIRGEFIRDENNQQIIDENAPVVEVGPNTDGSGDLFNVMAPSYRELRGVADWDGWRAYERPGYLKIGTLSTTDAFVSTPALANINEDEVNLKVSVDIAIWEGALETVLVDVVNGGTVSTTELTVSNFDSWETQEFFVHDATPNTKVLFKSFPEEGQGRFLLTNVLIEKAE